MKFRLAVLFPLFAFALKAQAQKDSVYTIPYAALLGEWIDEEDSSRIRFIVDYAKNVQLEFREENRWDNFSYTFKKDSTGHIAPLGEYFYWQYRTLRIHRFAGEVVEIDLCFSPYSKQQPCIRRYRKKH